jgi:hypothetical protein
MAFNHKDGTPVRNISFTSYSGINFIKVNFQYDGKSTVEFENILYISDSTVKDNSIIFQNELYSPLKDNDKLVSRIIEIFGDNLKVTGVHPGAIIKGTITNCKTSLVSIEYK